jgi:hypothetical protein
VGTINQKGGIDVQSSNGVITTGEDALTQEALPFSYCVSNGKMSWTQKVANPTITGSIAFQKGSVAGSGGTGGITSSGGSGGAGGTTATGGAGGGAGGAVGGASGAGGAVGGASGAGGAGGVRRNSDESVKDVPLLAAGGYADSKVQDDFCAGGCTVAKLYDQSPRKNDLPLTYPPPAATDVLNGCQMPAAVPLRRRDLPP